MVAEYYRELLTATPHTPGTDFKCHFLTPAKNTMNVVMSMDITDDQIKDALFSIPDDKAPDLMVSPPGSAKKVGPSSKQILRQQLGASSIVNQGLNPFMCLYPVVM